MKEERVKVKGLVSVIIPVHNGEKFIVDAIESVLSQTYDMKMIEIIIIDDCSTDDTMKVIEKYQFQSQEDNPKIIIIQQPINYGSAIARNIGLKMASGEYIAFLDCDDYYEPKKIQIQVELFENHQEKNDNVGLIYTSYLNHNLLTNKITNYVHPKKPNLLQDNHICLSTVMIKAEVLDKIGLFDPRTGGSCDWDLYVRTESAGYKRCYYDEPLLTYQVHDNNTALVRKNRATYELEKKHIILRKAYIRRGKSFNIWLIVIRTRIELSLSKNILINNRFTISILRYIYRILNKVF